MDTWFKASPKIQKPFHLNFGEGGEGMEREEGGTYIKHGRIWYGLGKAMFWGKGTCYNGTAKKAE